MYCEVSSLAETDIKEKLVFLCELCGSARENFLLPLCVEGS